MALIKCKECEKEISEEEYNLHKGYCKRCHVELIVWRVIILGTIFTIICYGIVNFIIKKQKRIEKYNNDLATCYELIKNDSNYDKFISIKKEHAEEEDFSSNANNKLYQAIDERIENIKNGNDDENLISMLNTIKDEEVSNLEINERYVKATSYSNLIKARQFIDEQKYKEAYDLLETVITNNKSQNQEMVNIATNEQNEIKNNAFEQIIAQAQEKINAKDYYSAKILLGKYDEAGNQTILDMYNDMTKKINKIEAEKKAQKEAEEKARKKSQGVTIGMTQQDVLDSSWGAPNHINKTTTKYGIHEQWVYGGGSYLYFDDGILTSIQN